MQAARGRAKHWIRVERYWEGEFPDVALKFRPVMCQQCDAAPCEPVCPTYASHHTEDGLNAQVYNRCIGTRYCANACPYNVRFFDFFNPSWDKPLHLQLNPDVSLREVGVMEKCTFCVQRIKAAHDSGQGREARAQGRRHQTGLRAGVPVEGARVRRPERSGERGVAAVAIAARHASCSRTSARMPNVTYLTRADARYEPPALAQRDQRATCCGRCCRRRGGSTSSCASSAASSLMGLSAWARQMYYGFGVTGISWPVLLGLLRHELRLLDRHQPRRHADLRDPAAGERRLAAAGDALRRGHHRLRADDRRDVSDHPPRAARGWPSGWCRIRASG